MTVESTSLSIGAVAALGSIALQQTSGQITGSSFVVPILSAVVGGAMSYAVLKTTVSNLEERFKDHEQQVRANTAEVYGLLRDCMRQLAHIEGQLQSRD